MSKRIGFVVGVVVDMGMYIGTLEYHQHYLQVVVADIHMDLGKNNSIHNK